MLAQIRRTIPLLVVTFLLCLIPVTAAFGQEAGFSDTFDDPALPGWEVLEGAQVSDGRLILPEVSEIARVEEWAQFEIFGQVRLAGRGEFVLSTLGGQLTFTINGSYAALFLDGKALFEGAIESIPEGEWFTFAWVVTPDTLQAVINGQNVYEGSSPALNAPGRVHLGHQGPGYAELEFIEGSGLLASPMQEEEEPEATPTTPGSIPDQPSPAADRLPAHQIEKWTHLGGPIGGLGYDIRYSYFDHNTWYVTDAWSGIHRSTDRGLTWQPVNQGISAIRGVDGVPIFTLTTSHLEDGVVWSGTELSGQIYRSDNGGDSWVEMSNGIDKSLLPLSFRGITIHPTDPNTLYAMAEIASMGWTADGSERKGIEMDLSQGIVYKTTDGGNKWREVWRGNNLARYAWISPDDPETVYVSTGIFDRESANTDVEAGIAGGVGILKTTDGGQSWQVINQEQGLLDLYVASLYMHPEDPDTLLAAAAQNNWSHMADPHTSGVYLTQDGGSSWQRVLDQPEMYGSVEFCVSDPNIAYAASLEAVYRSEDGGHNWQRFGRPDESWGPPGIIAGNPIDMQCDPDDPKRIFVNNYGGGNFLSTDGGQTWVNASQGYSGAIIHVLAIAPGQPGWVYAGGRSGLFRSIDGGLTWESTAYPSEEFLGTPMSEVNALAIDPGNPRRVLSGPLDVSGLLMSENGGNSWALMHGVPVSPTNISFAPSDPSIAYASHAAGHCAKDVISSLEEEICQNLPRQLYLSNDGGLSWQQPSQKETPGGGFLTFSVHPAKANTLITGTYEGGIYRSADGGKNWQPLGADQLKGLPRNLAFDPSQPETIYAAMDEGGLYKSIDGGSSWRRLSAGLIPEASLWSIAVDPTDSNTLYLADQKSGVYYSTDGGESWQAINEGLTHRTVNVLALSDDGSVLYAGIEGAGVYRLGTPPPVTGVDDLMSGSLLDGEQEQGEPAPEGADLAEVPDEGEILESADAGRDDESAESADDKKGPLGCPSSFIPLLLVGAFLFSRRRFVHH